MEDIGAIKRHVAYNVGYKNRLTVFLAILELQMRQNTFIRAIALVSRPVSSINNDTPTVVSMKLHPFSDYMVSYILPIWVNAMVTAF